MFSIRNHPQTRTAIRNPQSAIRKLGLLIAAALMLACADGAGSSRPTAENPVNEDKPAATTAFDGERAFNHVKAQVEFGPHPAGTPALEKTREYLVQELKNYGLKTMLDEFTETTPRGAVKFKNVIAELPGES